MKKLLVGILGATGTVGQKLIDLLSRHPWFEIGAVAASGVSVGQVEPMTGLPLVACHPDEVACPLVFSSLPTSVAGEIELAFAKAGKGVISNSSIYRMHPKVPLLIPEVNPDHLKLLLSQSFGPGWILTNPNCSVIGLALALKPLVDRFGVEAVQVVTLQATSGAGRSERLREAIQDNVIPYIEGEEAKIEQEPQKLFGAFESGGVRHAKMKLSALSTRVPVSDGHLACISVKLNKAACREELIEAWENFSGLDLPSAPNRPTIYLDGEADPQPKLHRDLEGGMSVAVGRLQKCSVLDWKFVVLSHNTVRGAAGSAILNGELLIAQEGELGELLFQRRARSSLRQPQTSSAQ